MGPGSPFPDFVNTIDIERASLIQQYRPQRSHLFVQKAGCEGWSTAWSPDSSYLGWSSGNRIVQLIPWNRYKHRPVEQDDRDLDGNCLTHKPLVIDAGELVWALAFGSSSCHHGDIGRQETRKDGTVRYRFLVAKDLMLATGLARGRIRTWDVRTGHLLLELCDHKDVIRSLKFAPDGSMRLISASRDGTLKVWDLNDDGNMSRTMRGTSKWIYSCAWSPNGKMLCSVGNAKSVLLWDMDTYKRLRKLDGHHNDVCDCDFSPDGALLVTSSYDTRVIIWDPHTGEQLTVFGHMFPLPSMLFAGGANDSYCRGVSFSRDGIHIATISDDTYVRFWDTNDPSVPEQVGTVSNTLCCDFSPDGSCLAVGTRDGSLTTWLAPMRVSSLQHLCRMSLRHLVTETSHVDHLQLPTRLRRYLQYAELKEPRFSMSKS